MTARIGGAGMGGASKAWPSAAAKPSAPAAISPMNQPTWGARVATSQARATSSGAGAMAQGEGSSRSPK